MNKYNKVDCCFDCAKQFNDNLCMGYCRNDNNCGKGDCTPGGCKEFKRKISNNKEEENNMNSKTLNIQNVEQAKEKINDIKVYGDGDTFALLCKASSKNQKWMKSTKVCNLPNGCLVQVSTQQGDNVAEGLTFVPGVNIDKSIEPRCFKLIEKFNTYNNETINITLEEYNKLLKDSNFLEALKCAGVDNWKGYSEAIELLEEWDEDEE